MGGKKWVRTALLAATALLAQVPRADAQNKEDTSTSSWTYMGLRPTYKSSDGSFSLSVRARVQLDTGFFDQDGDVGVVTATRDVAQKDLKSRAILRRVYFGAEGRAFKDFWYEYRMDFGGTKLGLEKPIINIGRVAYKIGSETGSEGQSLFRINAGVIKPMLTYDDAVSSASLMFIERADSVNIATSAFGGSTSRLGIETAYQQTNFLQPYDNFVFSVALTGGDPSGRSQAMPHNNTVQGSQLVGRVIYRLPFGDVSGLQLGADFSHIFEVAKSSTDGSRVINLQEYPELREERLRLVGTGPIYTDGGGFWGLEGVANLGKFFTGGEFYKFHLQRDRNCARCTTGGDPEFSGWYVFASWMLTDENKMYQANATNNGYATFNNPHVLHPFSLDGRGWGAWEAIARYSDLDLNWNEGKLGTECNSVLTGCIRGGEQKIWTIGLNWYANDNVRLMFNYMIVDLDRLSAAGKQSGQTFRALGTRIQFTN